jgi:hypothetical protein
LIHWSILSNPQPFVFDQFWAILNLFIWKHMNVYENIWMYMKTFEWIWKHMNVYENMWNPIMKVIKNSATRASCHLSCWVQINFVRMKSRWLKQVNKSG